MRNVLAIIILFLAACNPSKPKLNTLDVGFFSIQSPVNWRLVDSSTSYRTIAGTVWSSKSGQIAIGQNDTVRFELGYFANIPQEYRVLVLNRSDTSYCIPPDFSDTTQDNFQTEDVSKEMLPHRVSTLYSYIDFNGRLAVLHKPVKTGVGITGVHIDSLWSNRSTKENFILSGRNLSPSSQSELLEAIKTLKFRQPT